MSQRSPISVLQEITQQRLIQPPIYNIENSAGIGRFLCTVKVMGITARAYGCNKKDAKHRAAKRALEIIGFKNNSNPNDDEDDQSDEDDEVCQPQCSPQKVKALENSRFISDSVKTDNSPCQFKYLPTSSSNSLSLAYNNCNSKATDKAKDLEAPGYGSIGNTEKCERQSLQISSSNAWLSDCKQIAAERIKALGSPKYRSIGIGCNINSNANNCDDDDDDEGDEMYQPQCSQISIENYDYKKKSVGVERSLERPGYISNNFAFYSNSNYGAFDENDELYPPQSLPKSKASEDPRYASNDITADHEKNQIKYTPPKSSSGNGNTLPPTTYVGYLNKFALERQVPYPKYFEIKHSGIIFVVECVFWSDCTVGTGPNVESAKEKAAQLMLQRLEEEEEIAFMMMCNNKVSLAELYHVSKDRRFWKDFRTNPVVQGDANGPIQDLINTRNPISVLQDIVQQRRIRLPIYNIERGMNIGQPFVCTVEVMGITAKAYGHNKKDAKYNAAERALEILGLKINSNPHDDGPESSSTSSSNSLPSTNYVGQLNEIASGSRFPYPTYQEHKGSLSSFVVECQFLNQSTMGTGPTKKSAKQRAAQLMLEG
ncbi:unnamed protein product [Callosobruchus maculatus]|uniref:DRBM domain-containing protein n=1 Tax=Callosobruchus maculatus TaxID=64391 RepID=A0A653DSC1_CALMS|nr:unnamed protein product [Callosobruchus maculatus]